MNTRDKFSTIFFVINDLGITILKKINDYENQIENDPLIKKRFYNIEFVYMHSIILDIAKLISATNSDKSGLKQLISFCNNKDILTKFNDFKIKYEKTFKKIKSNRDKIIAHIDISDRGSYFNMGFSEIEISKKIDNYKRYLKDMGQKSDHKLISDLEKLKAVSSGEERYSPSDFLIEIPEIKNIVGEVLEISSNLLKLYFYNNQT